MNKEDAWRHNKPWTNEEKYLLLQQVRGHDGQCCYFTAVERWAKVMRRIPNAIECRLQVFKLVDPVRGGLVDNYGYLVDKYITRIEEAYPGIENSRVIFNTDGSIQLYKEPARFDRTTTFKASHEAVHRQLEAYAEAMIYGSGQLKIDTQDYERFRINVDGTRTFNKEQEMKVETKHFLNGRDIATLSDDELFQAIAAVEKNIKTLEEIENKPKRLVAKIEELRSGLKTLIEYLDSE